MSLLRRLWCRAPAWRLSVLAALGFTALVAMFPPTPLPSLRPPLPATQLPAARTSDFSPAARFTPDAGPTRDAPAGVMRPPAGAGREGLVPVAGRTIALPAGRWREIVFGRTGDPVPKQMTMLAHAEDRQLLGLMMVLAPDAAAGAAGLVDKVEACTTDGIIAGEVAPFSPGKAPFDQECWVLTEADMTGTVTPENRDKTMQGAIKELEHDGIAVPPRMLAFRYIRSSATGWLLVELFLPEHPADGQRADRRQLLWCKHYAGLLHKAYDGTLTAAELGRDAVMKQK